VIDTDLDRHGGIAVVPGLQVGLQRVGHLARRVGGVCHVQDDEFAVLAVGVGEGEFDRGAVGVRVAEREHHR
jgi:hypothetical protein